MASWNKVSKDNQMGIGGISGDSNNSYNDPTGDARQSSRGNVDEASFIGGIFGEDDERSWDPGQENYYWRQGTPDFASQRMGNIDKGGNVLGRDANYSLADRYRGYDASSRGDQSNALQALADRAAGRNSVVAQQSSLSQQNALKAIASQAASARGGYNPMSARTAIMQQSGMGQQIAGQEMTARMQEQQGAEQAYYQALAQRRQQDLAGMGQEMQYGTGLRGQDLQDWEARQRATLAWQQAGQQEKQSEYAARVAYERAKQAAFMGKQTEDSPYGWIAPTVATGVATYLGASSDVRAKENIEPAGGVMSQFNQALGQVQGQQAAQDMGTSLGQGMQQASGSLAGSPLGGAMGSMLTAAFKTQAQNEAETRQHNAEAYKRAQAIMNGEGMVQMPSFNPVRYGDAYSDERCKRAVTDSAREMREFLGRLREKGPQQYDYRPGAPQQGHSYGPMAQDLEAAGPVGRNLVGRDENGLRFIDGPKTLTTLLAAVGQQQREIDALKRRF